MPGTGLQLAGRPGHAAVWLLFCFRENGIIGCCGCGIGARDWMLGKRACVRVCVSLLGWAGAGQCPVGEWTGGQPRPLHRPYRPDTHISPGPRPGPWECPRMLGGSQER